MLETFCHPHNERSEGQITHFQTENNERRHQKADLAFREGAHEGAAGSLVAAGIGLVRRVRPIVALTLTVEEKAVLSGTFEMGN